MSEGNIKPYDFGIIGGLGLSFPIHFDNFCLLLALEGGYNLGLLNTFSEDELDGDAIVLNPSQYVYAPKGSRSNRGIEAAVTLSLPLGNFHATHKPTPEPVVVETVPEPEPQSEVLEYEIKECYSFEEMYSFLKLGVDVSDKRICVFDMKFQYASAKLMRSSEQYLDNVVSMMNAFPEMKISINGHTDNIGSESSNRQLSEQRARSVFNYLLKRGIAADRMSCHGYGMSYPIDSNDTEEGRARNRRVEIEVIDIK